MPATPEDLFAKLRDLNITTNTLEHEPAFTVEQAKAVRGDLPGGHCKNLFLRNKKGVMWLVVTLEDRTVDIKRLGEILGAGRLSFGSPERLQTYLGVTPGTVTPFALINDAEQQVHVALDKTMLEEETLHYHPLDNSMTTAIKPDDLLRFIKACGHEAHVVEL